MRTGRKERIYRDADRVETTHENNNIQLAHREQITTFPPQIRQFGIAHSEPPNVPVIEYLTHEISALG